MENEYGRHPIKQDIFFRGGNDNIESKINNYVISQISLNKWFSDM